MQTDRKIFLLKIRERVSPSKSADIALHGADCETRSQSVRDKSSCKKNAESVKSKIPRRDGSVENGREFIPYKIAGKERNRWDTSRYHERSNAFSKNVSKGVPSGETCK
ncbi:hypothetical protein PUN28_000208 [Cardiocondyla obscurior]|uniref:Uncharacterized protein n=1 Tax=Cardiocondyla obscurior TaxID=286306 RepID=A0AAW2GYN4_9HYME